MCFCTSLCTDTTYVYSILCVKENKKYESPYTSTIKRKYNNI